MELKITHEELMKRIEILENENKDLRKRKRSSETDHLSQSRTNIH